MKLSSPASPHILVKPVEACKVGEKAEDPDCPTSEPEESESIEFQKGPEDRRKSEDRNRCEKAGSEGKRRGKYAPHSNYTQLPLQCVAASAFRPCLFNLFA